MSGKSINTRNTKFILTLITCVGLFTKDCFASDICFDFDSSNCASKDRFVDLLGDAPKHYKTYFDDREKYFAENIFQHFEYLTHTLTENLPTEPIKYDYNSAYIQLSDVKIFKRKPLVIEVESWGPYIGCCFSDEYSVYFNADGFNLSDAHKDFTDLYLCRTSKVGWADFIQEHGNLKHHGAEPISSSVDQLINIQCGRRYLRINQDSELFSFNKEAYER